MKKSLPVLPAAIAGIILLVLIAVGLNAVFARSAAGSARLDLTEHKIHTLSDGTRNILKNLDTPVTIRFYFTEGSRALPRGVKLFADRVRDFLRQYESYGKGKVKLEVIDVQPDSEAEDSARLDGIRGQEISVTETVYFGISVSALDRKQSIPQIGPDQETMLEYNISRAITQVIRPARPKLGILSGLPLIGNGMPPQMGGQPGWIIHQQLEMDYEIVSVEPAATEIPGDLAALLVVHPADLSPETEFALDQYLLKGGKAAIFLDAHYYFNQPQQSNPMMPAPGAPTASTLPNLLKAWGLTFESGLVVADQRYRFSRQGRVLTGVSSFNGEESIDPKDPVTSQLRDVFMILPGGYSGSPVVGLHKNVLVRTSSMTQLLDPMRASQWDQNLLTEIAPSNQSFDMVVRLVGRFPTAFPDGKPGAATPPADAADGADGAEKDGEAKDQLAAALKEASAEGAVVLFADVDMIADQGAFESNPLVPQMVQPFNGNFSLVLNTLEQLTGDQNLIGARSRPSSRRPFKVMEEMQAQAEQRAAEKINELVKSEQDFQQKISSLRADQIGKDGEILLTPEQQTALEDAMKKQSEVRKELRELRKELAKDKERLEANLTIANILIMPALVALAGLGIALYRRTRTAAR
jgi:ABC-type uncharacterized transport system involved in gliding motility auxiliary subunit